MVQGKVQFGVAGVLAQSVLDPRQASFVLARLDQLVRLLLCDLCGAARDERGA